MKKTVLVYPNGTVVATLPHKQTGSVLGDIINIQRMGNILSDNGNYSVTFLDEDLSKYNKTAFSTYDEAVAYEQDILDTHLHEKFAV